ELLESLRRVGRQELAVGPFALVRRQVGIAVAVEVLDACELEGDPLLRAAAVEDRHGMAAGERDLDDLRAEERGAAQDQDPFLRFGTHERVPRRTTAQQRRAREPRDRMPEELPPRRAGARHEIALRRDRPAYDPSTKRLQARYVCRLHQVNQLRS